MPRNTQLCVLVTVERDGKAEDICFTWQEGYKLAISQLPPCNSGVQIHVVQDWRYFQQSCGALVRAATRYVRHEMRRKPQSVQVDWIPAPRKRAA